MHSLGAIGKDKNSEIILNTLNKNKILTTNLQVFKGSTSVQHIKNLPNGEKAFFNYQAGVLGIVKPTPNDFKDLSDYHYKTSIVEKYVGSFDIGFFGLNHNQHRLSRKLSSIAKKHNKLFVITLAEKGSIAFEGKIKYQQEAIPVNKIADTTGAGDAFISAFLAEYLESKNIQKSLYAGSTYSAKIIQKYGAN